MQHGALAREEAHDAGTKRVVGLVTTFHGMTHQYPPDVPEAEVTSRARHRIHRMSAATLGMTSWMKYLQSERRRSDVCKPTSVHNVFTHFLKDPNCEICKMTMTTRARRNMEPDSPFWLKSLWTSGFHGGSRQLGITSGSNRFVCGFVPSSRWDCDVGQDVVNAEECVGYVTVELALRQREVFHMGRT